MKAYVGYEIRRFFLLSCATFLVLHFLMAQYFTYFGAMKYKNFQDEVEAFLEYEKLKVETYSNYEQYGAFGFRVLLVPPPLSVFSHSFLYPVESKVDIKDVLNISSQFKGRKIFSNNGLGGDLSTLFQVFGTLLVFYFGYHSFPGNRATSFHKNRFILGTISTRYVMLMIFFTVELVTSYLFAEVLGIRFSGTDTQSYLNYSTGVLSLLTFFFLLGLLLSVIFKFKRVHALNAYLVWFIIVFVIPMFYNMDLEQKVKSIPSNELVSIKKLRNWAKSERKMAGYFKNLQEKKVKDIRALAQKLLEEHIRKVIPINNAIENHSQEEVKKVIAASEKKSVLLPPYFYSFSAREVSGAGYYGYVDFLNYVLERRIHFIDYYFQKRYKQIDQTVESFVRNGENLYYSRSRLPVRFWQGLTVTLIYSSFFLVVTLLLIWKRQHQSKLWYQGIKAIELDTGKLEAGKTYFYLFTGQQEKAGIFKHLQARGALLIAKPTPMDIDTGTSLNTWLRFERQSQGLDAAKLEEALKLLKVTARHLKQKIKELDEEAFSKAFLALKLSQDRQIYLFDQLLSRCSKDMEKTVKETFNILKPHAVLIYFSSQMFEVMKQSNRRSLSNKDLPLLMIDWTDITLR